MFKFSLQTALDVRARQEKIRMKELAEKLSVQRSIQSKMDGIESNISNQEGLSDTSKKAGRIDIMQLRMLQNFKDKSKIDLGHLGQEFTQSEYEVEEKRLALVDASRLRKTLEILREKEVIKHNKKMADIEREMLDEVAGNMFVRKSRDGA
ncbi:MAG: flagellar export protein FliJ [SAR324 cluster bacterium]|nr:flagellar export protein FliJ [SAR324 cluster bacterium]